jgi:hypothetical protein
MLQVKELTGATFETYGRFLNPYECGEPVGSKAEPLEFYPDRILQQFSASNYVAFNPLIIKPRPLSFTLAEIHRRTEEVFGGFTEDVCFHVAPAGDRTPPIDRFEVFRLPAGWWARIKRGVWHHGPFVTGNVATAGMVVLPPHTYTNDCYVVELDEAIQISL